jgi:hypothetical protein
VSGIDRSVRAEAQSDRSERIRQFINGFGGVHFADRISPPDAISAARTA